MVTNSNTNTYIAQKRIVNPTILDLKGAKSEGKEAPAKELETPVVMASIEVANRFRPVPNPVDPKLLAKVRGSELIRELRECKTNEGELFYMVGWARSSVDTLCQDALHFPIGSLSDARFVCPGEHSIDIGASFGDTTIPMALLAAPGGGRTVAFEPYTAAFTVLD